MVGKSFVATSSVPPNFFFLPALLIFWLSKKVDLLWVEQFSCRCDYGHQTVNVWADHLVRLVGSFPLEPHSEMLDPNGAYKLT